MTISFWHYLILSAVFLVFGLFFLNISHGNVVLLGLALIFILLSVCIGVAMVF